MPQSVVARTDSPAVASLRPPAPLFFLRCTKASMNICDCDTCSMGDIRVTATVLVCVCCVAIPFILDVRLCGRTGRGHTGGRSHRICPPSFCGACLNFYREKDSAVPFPRRLGSRIIFTHQLIVLHFLGMIFIFIFYFILLFVRKNPSLCDCSEIRTHLPKSEGFELTN